MQMTPRVAYGPRDRTFCHIVCMASFLLAYWCSGSVANVVASVETRGVAECTTVNPRTRITHEQPVDVKAWVPFRDKLACIVPAILSLTPFHLQFPQGLSMMRRDAPRDRSRLVHTIFLLVSRLALNGC